MTLRKLRLTVVDDHGLSRREAITVIAGTALVACGGTAAVDGKDAAVDDAGDDSATADDSSGCMVAGKSYGPVSSFPAGTWKRVGSGLATVIIAQDANGLFAFSAICTHSGCVVDPPSATGRTFCACHGSLFDGNGAVLQGPARRALAHYAVAVCNDLVLVDTASPVSAATREPVP